MLGESGKENPDLVVPPLVRVGIQSSTSLFRKIIVISEEVKGLGEDFTQFLVEIKHSNDYEGRSS